MLYFCQIFFNESALRQSFCIIYTGTSKRKEIWIQHSDYFFLCWFTIFLENCGRNVHEYHENSARDFAKEMEKIREKGFSPY